MGRAIKQLVGGAMAFVPLVLAAIVGLVFYGEPLDGIDGRRPAPSAGGRDFLDEATRALTEGRRFRCTEAELNRHLAAALRVRESDGFEAFSEFRGLWIDLQASGPTVIIEREVLGLPATVSAKLRLEAGEGGLRVSVRGGKFGRLPVPAGALRLVREGLEHAAAACAPETELINLASDIQFEDGSLQLIPEGNAADQP